MVARMRVCLFTPTFLPLVGGAERDADLIARRFIDRGHQVMVLAQSARGHEPELPYPVMRYRRPPPLQHLWPGCLKWPLIRAHRACPFDVILAWYAYPTGYAAGLVKRKLGVGLVISPRGGDLYPNFHALRKPGVPRTIRAGYRNADRIVSISNWLTERLHQVAGNPGGGGGGLPPIDLVYNGIDLAEHDHLRDQSRAHPPSLPIRKPFILHLARVAPVKRQTLAVQAVHQLRDTFRQRKLTYAIVGDGNGMQDVRRLIDKLAVADIVKLLGTRVGLEKAWLLDNARFMVSTSREEGLGNVVLEAMASGLPMLASDIGPHQELIGAHHWGTLFRSGNLDDLCQKLRSTIDADPAPWSKRALATRTGFSLNAMIDGYERACQQVLSHPSHPAG